MNRKCIGKNIVKKTDFDQNQIKVANRYMFLKKYCNNSGNPGTLS